MLTESADRPTFPKPVARLLEDSSGSAFFALNIMGVGGTTYFVLQYFVRERDQAMAALDREHRLLQAEREKSERLLLNVLPQAIAERLKEADRVIADRFSEVTVLFADIVGFTPLAGTMEPEALVELLNELFTRFDALAAHLGLEKIKTIGDAYMVAGGLPAPRQDHAGAVADMALAMREVVPGDQRPHRARDGRPNRHRHRTRRRRRDRPSEVQLRPVGRHRQHREPNGVTRRARFDPGDRTNLRASEGRLPADRTRRDRGQGQRFDANLLAGGSARGRTNNPTSGR